MKNYDVGNKTIYELAAALIEAEGLHAKGHYGKERGASIVGALAWGARYVSLELHGGSWRERNGNMEAITRDAMEKLRLVAKLKPTDALDAHFDELDVVEALGALELAHMADGDALRSPPTVR
jgi:hypothetical protein